MYQLFLYTIFLYNNKVFLSLFFAFLRIFSPHLHFAFETALRFIFHWGQFLFMEYPSHSTVVESQMMTLIRHFNREVAEQVEYIGCAELLMEFIHCVFTNVLPKDGCLVLLDVLITFVESPELLVVFAVAMLLIHRERFLKLERKEQWKDFMFEVSKTDVV